MQREIKFRVWSNAANKYFENSAAVYRMFAETPVGNSRLVFEQFTGLHDKDLNEIYEGDIVQLWHEGIGYMGEEATTNVTSVVKFVDGAFWIENEPMYAYPADDLEVLGNIHENADLLEEK